MVRYIAIVAKGVERVLREELVWGVRWATEQLTVCCDGGSAGSEQDGWTDAISVHESD